MTQTAKNGAAKVSRPVADVSSISAAEVQKKLEALAKAEKEGQLRQVAATGPKWEPEKKGEKLRGMYLGDNHDGRNRTHVFAVAEDGRTLQKIVAGSHSLNHQMRAVEPGTAVVVTFDGTEDNEGGKAQRLFTVYKP